MKRRVRKKATRLPVRWSRVKKTAWCSGHHYTLRQDGAVIATVDESRDRKGWYWYGYGRNTLTMDEFKEHRGVWDSPKEAKTACRAWITKNNEKLWAEHAAATEKIN